MNNWKLKMLEIMPSLKRTLKCDECGKMDSMRDILEDTETGETKYVCHQCSRKLRGMKNE